MTNRFQTHLRGAATFTAIAAALALAGCNPSGSVDRSQTTSQAASLPALPATLPLAPGGVTTPAYAPAAKLLPAARPIRTVRVADPRDSYAYADDAWGFADALGDAPPDYGFDYGDAQPWAWQGYDDSVAFVEPLDDGYRYYYYRAGSDTPYFVRDPDYGYGYDNGQLAVIYDRGGGLVPYADYGPRLDYASRYYVRGRDLYQASRQRRPVIAANWAARRDAIVDAQRWAAARAEQRAWQDYHQRTEARQAEHWREEQARRRADEVRFATWQGQDFNTPPPPRAIPAAWTRAKWAQDQRRFAPPAPGFTGDAAARERAAMEERERVARAARRPLQQTPGAFVAGPGLQRQQPQPQDQQRADFARQQAERAQRAQALGDQRLAAQQHALQETARQQREQALRQQQQQAQASQLAAARDAQVRARQQADRAGEQARRRQAQANERAQAQQHAQAEMQQRRQEQARQAREQVQQRQAAQVQQRAQEHARAQEQARGQEQAARAQARQAAQAQQRQAEQAQQRAQIQARAQERQAAQAQQRAEIQAQAQQRQAAQAQQRAEIQARQRPAAPPPQAHPAPVPHPQPAALVSHGNPGNGGGHKHEPH